MFAKSIALLPLLAASAIAQWPIKQGTYIITNVDSLGTARVDDATGQIYVSTERPNPDQSDVWDLRHDTNFGYSIQNVGLGTYAAVLDPRDGAPVLTHRYPRVFNLEFAGDGAYVIKLQNNDLLWNVEPPIIPTGDVAVRPADGKPTQHWGFSPIQVQGSNLTLQVK